MIDHRAEWQFSYGEQHYTEYGIGAEMYPPESVTGDPVARVTELLTELRKRYGRLFIREWDLGEESGSGEIIHSSDEGGQLRTWFTYAPAVPAPREPSDATPHS